jgi:hypothetical protein
MNWLKINDASSWFHYTHISRCTVNGTYSERVKYNSMCGAFVADIGIALPKYSTKNPSHFQFVHHVTVVDMFWEVLKNGLRVQILGAPFHKKLWGNGYKAPGITGLGSICTVVVFDSHYKKGFSHKMSAPWYTHTSCSVSFSVEVRKTENLNVRR